MPIKVFIKDIKIFLTMKTIKTLACVLGAMLLMVGVSSCRNGKNTKAVEAAVDSTEVVAADSLAADSVEVVDSLAE